MSVKLFVGSLSWGTDNESLRQRFEEFGQVEDAVVIRDRETGRSRGFGFVTYSNPEEADAAIAGLNEQEFDGRTIKVDRASQRDNSSGGFRPRGRGGFRGSFGGGYGGNNNRDGPRDYNGDNQREGQRESYGRSDYNDRY
ncbi:hypothetical protein K7432_010026 [Basidiobolus ranarum]|uniref:RRM domain-containing protein n=1 Tax=Basidiobolus ranarum TaxID=34480 RepID=A0ABR2WPG3_9FUNG